MLVTRTSIFSGVTRTINLPITVAQLLLYNSGTLIQDAFPSLTTRQREFFKTGVTSEEWDAQFPPEDGESHVR